MTFLKSESDDATQQACSTFTHLSAYLLGLAVYQPTQPRYCEPTQATGVNTLGILFLLLSGTEPIQQLCLLTLSLRMMDPL